MVKNWTKICAKVEIYGYVFAVSDDVGLIMHWVHFKVNSYMGQCSDQFNYVLLGLNRTSE